MITLPWCIRIPISKFGPGDKSTEIVSYEDGRQTPRSPARSNRPIYQALINPENIEI